jgi:tetratricopeptide (TPR) repeat protein
MSQLLHQACTLRISVLALGILVLIPQFSTAQEPPTEPALEAIQQAIARGDWLVAVQSATELIERGELLSQAYALRGLAFGRLQRYEEAQRDLAAALEHDPKSVQAMLLRGELQLLAGQLQQAISDFSRVIELAPRHVLAHARRARAHQMRGDLAAALADCDQAIALSPKHPGLVLQRSSVRLAHGDHAGAIADVERVLALEPAPALRVEALLTRARALAALGRHAEAMACCNDVLYHSDGVAAAYELRGRIKLAAGDPFGAVEDALRGLQLAPELNSARELLSLGDEQLRQRYGEGRVPPPYAVRSASQVDLAAVQQATLAWQAGLQLLATRALSAQVLLDRPSDLSLAERRSLVATLVAAVQLSFAAAEGRRVELVVLTCRDAAAASRYLEQMQVGMLRGVVSLAQQAADIRVEVVQAPTRFDLEGLPAYRCVMARRNSSMAQIQETVMTFARAEYVVEVSVRGGSAHPSVDDLARSLVAVLQRVAQPH